MTLSDADLDTRLRAAGHLLDEQAAARVTARARRAPRHRRVVALAAALLVVLSVTSAAIIVTRDQDDDGARIDTGTTTVPSTTTTDPTSPEALRALGATGLVVTRDALVDLGTGETTPLVSAGNPALGSAAAVPDGSGGLYYMSHDAEADPDDPNDFGRTDLRHLTDDGDVVVEAGARSFALRADGALAISVPEDPIDRNGLQARTRIDVIAPGGTRTTWTTDLADYHVTAWAGERLIGGRGLPETEAFDAIVFDGPGQVRLLGSYGGLVRTVSPDGSWVVMGRLDPGEELPDGDEPLEPPEVVDVATGETIGTVDPGPDVAGISGLAWAGDDRLVGWGAPEPAGPYPILEVRIVDGVDGGIDLAVTRTWAGDGRVFSPTGVWAGDDGTVLAVAPTNDRRYEPRVLVCRPDADACAVEELPFDRDGGVSHPYDPSRP